MPIKIGNVIQAKAGTVERTDTTAKSLFTLPSQAMVTGVLGFGVASNATTTATLTLTATDIQTGTSTTLGTIDVKDSGVAAAGNRASLAGIAMLKQSAAQIITATYAETSAGASSTGGPYTVVVNYL